MQAAVLQGEARAGRIDRDTGVAGRTAPGHDHAGAVHCREGKSARKAHAEGSGGARRALERAIDDEAYRVARGGDLLPGDDVDGGG